MTLKIETGAAGKDKMTVRGVDIRLGQVVRNLIDNALSFSPPQAPVMISATRNDGTIRIVVEDSGPGIRPESLEKIFERFHTDRPDAFGQNSGLGLSISRQIVEAHHGRIWAENRSEGGARFTVELPAA